MKFFTLFLIVAAEKSLEDVYGPVEQVNKMSPKMIHGRTSKTFSADHCDFPLEVLILQDQTNSFEDDYAQMKDVQLPQMLEVLSATHPGTVFGVSTFKDKPISPYGIAATAENGYYSDYCVRFNVDFTTNETALREYYGSEKPNGGGDPAEAQFDAVLAVTQSPEVSWTDDATTIKLIVLVTDAPPHFEGDGDLAGALRPSSGVFDNDNPDMQCSSEYYPNPAQVANSLRSLNTYLATLVYDPEYWNGLPASSWKWFNSYYSQTDDFINLNAADSSNFWDNLAKVIKQIETIECGEVSPTPEIFSTAIVGPPVFVTESDFVSEPAPSVGPQGSSAASIESCPPCSQGAEPCPPCPPVKCPGSVVCQDGVYLKVGFEPESFEMKINGQQVDL